MSLDLTKDWLELLECLVEEKVSFLLIGGHALSVYGYDRLTKDIDIFVGQDENNAKRILKALKKFFGKDMGFRVAQFTAPDKVVMIGEPPYRVDILTTIEGVEFENAYQNRKEVAHGNFKLPVIGAHDLIQNKRSTGRTKDLSDVVELEKYLKAKELQR